MMVVMVVVEVVMVATKHEVHGLRMASRGIEGKESGERLAWSAWKGS